MATHRDDFYRPKNNTRTIKASPPIATVQDLNEFMEKIRDAANEDAQVRFEVTITGKVKLAKLSW